VQLCHVCVGPGQGKANQIKSGMHDVLMH